ncbi:MAG: hypothetical protein JWP75_421 [Frondihabitans sp.]|nr:hypothetical protein [Frondihabitans sp.]
MKIAVSAVALVIALGGLGGCGDDPPSTAGSSPASTVAPSAPAHIWQINEGREYGYPVALTEDQIRAGQGSSDVVMFRYLGNFGGVYKIARAEPNFYVVMSCANPCKVIRQEAASALGFEIDHMTFNPATIIGQAFTDAFNGQLEVYGTGAPQAETAPAATPPSPPDASQVSTAPSLSAPPAQADPADGSTPATQPD